MPNMRRFSTPRGHILTAESVGLTSMIQMPILNMLRGVISRKPGMRITLLSFGVENVRLAIAGGS